MSRPGEPVAIVCPKCREPVDATPIMGDRANVKPVPHLNPAGKRCPGDKIPVNVRQE